MAECGGRRNCFCNAFEVTFVRPAVESYSVLSLAAIPGAVMLEVIYSPGGSITQLALEPSEETWKTTIILDKHNFCHN